MAAGLGFKTFATGDVLSAADVNGYLMQGVLVFASAAARDAAITSPQEGQFAYLKDTNVTTYYTGSAWANLDTTGMTNPMTTTGDTIYSSSGSTPARLGIGSTGQVLTVASGIPSWATPAGSTLTVAQIATGTLSGASVTISSLSSYDQLFIQLRNVDMSSVTGMGIRVNNNSGASNYNWNGFSVNVTTGVAQSQPATDNKFMPFYQGNLPASAQDNCSGFTLSNCKAAGFTTAYWSSFYKSSNAWSIAESAQGQYLVSEAVSSLVFVAASGTFDGGTYTIWGG
jgi:hypothetical protein